MPIARIVTGTLLAGVLVAAVAWFPAWVLSALLIVVVVIAGFEWAQLARIDGLVGRSLYAAVIGVPAGFLVLQIDAAGVPLGLLVEIATLWWLCASVWIVAFQMGRVPYITTPLVLAPLGWFVLTAALAAVFALRQEDAALLLVLFALVWSADILAYAGGRTWGRTKMIDKVSPGKTWEGLVSALVGTLVLALGLNAWLFEQPFAAVIALVLSTFVAAVFGDLFESLLKRSRGLKDSGRILPGHGGVLDRVDSILAAAPVFWTLHHYLEL